MSILDMSKRQRAGVKIQWLATYLPFGPQPMCNRLAAWGRDYAAETEHALAPDQLRGAVKSLITLAHANSTVSLVEPPRGVFAQAEVQFEDHGYGACLFALINVLDCLPLPEDEIVELRRFAGEFRARQEEEIRQGLLGYELGHRPRQ